MYGIIYKVINKINNKCYIGQTIRTIEYRMSQHINDMYINRDNSVLHRALAKYGKNNFIWVVIEYCDSKEELDEMEFHYIKQYNSFGISGYNLTFGGEGSCGFKHSKRTKEKIGKKSLGNKNMLGKHHTTETKNKLSKANSGRKLPKRSEEWCRNISNAKLGSKQTKESIAKRQATRKKKNYLGTNNKLSKKYLISFSNSNEYLVEGLRHFCNTLFLNYKSFHTIALKRGKIYKGYKCRHYNESTDGKIPYYEDGIL